MLCNATVKTVSKELLALAGKMNSVCGDGGISISAHFFVQLLLQRKKRKAELYGKRSDDLAHFLKKRLPALIKSRTGKNKGSIRMTLQLDFVNIVKSSR